MKEVDYKPKAEGWSGSVKLKIPSYEARIKMAQEMGVANLKADDVGAQLDFVGSAVSRFKEHVIAVDLEYAGEKFQSLEDLGYYKEGSELIMEIGLVMIQGLSLGKN